MPLSCPDPLLPSLSCTSVLSSSCRWDPKASPSYVCVFLCSPSRRPALVKTPCTRAGGMLRGRRGSSVPAEVIVDIPLQTPGQAIAAWQLWFLTIPPTNWPAQHVHLLHPPSTHWLVLGEEGMPQAGRRSLACRNAVEVQILSPGPGTRAATWQKQSSTWHPYSSQGKCQC